MPKDNYIHLAVVMDRSGSMKTIAKDMEGGLKEFIDKQMELDGKATITLARFDDQYELVYDFVALKEAKDFALEPRGYTALLDAMGETMEKVRAKIYSMDDNERPNKVVFVFITDGGENASKSFTKDRIFEMISDLRNAKDDVNQPDEHGILWEVLFLGANQDAIQTGNTLGVRSATSLTYDASPEGSKMMFSSLNASMKCYRSQSDNTAYAFTQEDRDKQDIKTS